MEQHVLHLSNAKKHGETKANVKMASVSVVTTSTRPQMVALPTEVSCFSFCQNYTFLSFSVRYIIIPGIHVILQYCINYVINYFKYNVLYIKRYEFMSFDKFVVDKKSFFFAFNFIAKKKLSTHIKDH